MKRKTWIKTFIKSAGLATAGAVMLGTGSLPLAAGQEPADNIVLIHVDDLGWRDLGYMGSPVYETPNLDRLAASGTQFTNAYAASSICTPSRACMLTGSQPSRHGVYTVVRNRGEKEDWKVIPEDNNQFLPKEYPTIGTVLTDAGIAHGVIGKWHIGSGPPPTALPKANGAATWACRSITSLRSSSTSCPRTCPRAPTCRFTSAKRASNSWIVTATSGSSSTSRPICRTTRSKTRVPAGKVSDEPVSGIDFYPTICTVMGVKPTDPDQVDGEDLTGLIFRGTSLGERNLFWNFPCYNFPADPEFSPRSVIRRGHWKLHHRYEDNGYELYNLEDDIGESTDLSEERPEILAIMRRELDACYERFGAVKTLPPNPDFVAKPATGGN